MLTLERVTDVFFSERVTDVFFLEKVTDVFLERVTRVLILWEGDKGAYMGKSSADFNSPSNLAYLNQNVFAVHMQSKFLFQVDSL